MQVHKKDYVRLPSGCVKGGIKEFVSVFRFQGRTTNDLPRLENLPNKGHQITFPHCLKVLGTWLCMVW